MHYHVMLDIIIVALYCISIGCQFGIICLPCIRSVFSWRYSSFCATTDNTSTHKYLSIQYFFV